jgi:hypothetical protein
MTDKDEPEYVKGTERRKVPRPQPPHNDRRTKRERTRAEQERKAIEEDK